MACGTSDSEAEVSSLGSAAALIACSDHAFWGTVASTSQEADGVLVTFDIDEWVHPTSGPSQITLVADDPAEQVGAPEWTLSERVFVLDGRDSPLDRYAAEEAETIITSWDEPKSTPSCPEKY